MARMRTIKPDACSSESLAEVPRAARWTFACLWTYLDDEGRGVYNPRLIKAAIYPLDDDMTPAMVGAEIAGLEHIGCVCFYTIDGREYVHVPSWHGHQKPNHPQPSKLPPCPKQEHPRTFPEPLPEPSVNDPGTFTPVSSSRGEVVGVVEGEGVGAAAPRPAQKRGTRLPDDWRPGGVARAWTLERITQQDAAVELEKFRNHWLSKTGKDATKLDWDRTWRNWVLNARPAGRASPSGSTADQRVNDGLNLAATLRAEQNRKEIPA